MITTAQLMKKMIDFSDGSMHDITHLLKVWGYARTLGMLEYLDSDTQFILEAAAITHDIACPLCRSKYGHAAGPLQEKEGAILVRTFLSDADLPPSIVDRISYLVGHHHTLDTIDGIDYQILIEADYLVNAEECQYAPEDISNFSQLHFRTASGTALLRSIYPQAFL